MKKRVIFLTTIFLMAFCFSGMTAYGQEKTQEQKEKEAKLQKEIDLQKKAMQEQKKTEEIEKSLQEANIELDKTNDVLNDFYRRGRPTVIGRDGLNQYVFTPGGDYSSAWTVLGRGDSERTTWDFSKYVKESTFSKQYSFDVEKTVGTVVMSVMGDCKSGEIRVKIVMPGGRTYSDILIDEFGNLNWRKSFTISEEENKDKAGEWIFKIDATKATGSFKISLQTY